MDNFDFTFFEIIFFKTHRKIRTKHPPLAFSYPPNPLPPETLIA